jgi:hypothetical protein
MSTLPKGLALVALTGVAPWVVAAEPQAAAPLASVYAGFEIGNTDSRRLEAGASLRPNARWRASVALARADFDFPGADTTSTVMSAKASYDFGGFGVGAGLRRGEIDAVSETRGWLVSGFWEFREWRFSGEIETRDTELAAADFSDEDIPDLGVVSGVARCDVDSRGYQAQANLTSTRWTGFAAVRLFDYEEFDCALTIDAPATEPRRSRGRALGHRLAENTLDTVTGSSPRLIPREATLLDSSLSLGATLAIDDRWSSGGEIYRDVEFISGDQFLTALAFVGRRMSDKLDLEVWVGFAEAKLEDAAFAGVRLSADL